MRAPITLAFGTVSRVLGAALFAAAGAAVLLVGPLPSTLAFAFRPPGARRTSSEAAGAIVSLARAYQPSATMAAQPVFFARTVRRGRDSSTHRRSLWQGAVQVRGQQLSVVMNDRTGGLIYVFNRGVGPLAAGAIGPPIDTPLQAARHAFEAARRLGMIPADAQVALARSPARAGRDETWRVEWRVRRTSFRKPYLVTVTVSRFDGHLVSLVNEAEATSFDDA